MRGFRACFLTAALAIILAMLASAVSGPAAAQSAQRPGAAASKAQGKPPELRANELRANLAAAPGQAQAGRSEEETAQLAREREERAALERQLAEATVALANHSLAFTYATLGLILVAASLWVTSFLQGRDVRAAVRAVQEASAAAQSSTQLMQQALVLTQRATVIVGEPRAVWLRHPQAGTPDRLVGCRLLVTWHNVGTTPTRGMIAAVAGLATEKPPSPGGGFPKVDARQQPAIVGPNGSVASAHDNLPIGLVADILARRAYYQLAGWAEYNDVFERTPRHRVEFCYWVDFEGDLESQRLEARFHIHGKHNRHCEVEDDVKAAGPAPAGPETAPEAGPETVAGAPKVKYAGHPSGPDAVAQPG